MRSLVKEARGPAHCQMRSAMWGRRPRSSYISSLIERSYDRDFPVTFHFYQTNFNIRYGTGSCSDRFSRKYADTLIDLDIEVHLENYDSDQYVTLPQQIEHTLQTVF